MKRLTLTLFLAFALVFVASAGAGTLTYAGYYYWPAGQQAGSSFSSSWFRNTFSKSSPFDATITFIDNATYSWHSTMRSTGTYMDVHWLSSQVKKAHCRANATGSGYAACTVFS